jgi:hypothetical protein
MNQIRDMNRKVWKCYSDLLDYCNESSSDSIQVDKTINFYLTVYRPLEHAYTTQTFQQWNKTIENAFNATLQINLVKSDFFDEIMFIHCFELIKIIKDYIYLIVLNTGDLLLQNKVLNLSFNQMAL